MLNMIRRMAGALRSPTMAERERAYLDGAADRYDLECRERQIDQGLFRRMEHPATR